MLVKWNFNNKVKMKRRIVKIVFVAVLAMVGGINAFNAQKSETLSDVGLANVEALAQSETLPEVEIVCNSGDYGMCFWCRRYDLYDPIWGKGYGYECNFSGLQQDWCPSSCNSYGGGSFPA